MKLITKWLIVRATGETRIRASRPYGRQMKRDEIAFPLHITIPSEWARIADQAITLKMPVPSEPVVDIRGDEAIIGEGEEPLPLVAEQT